MFKFNGTSWVQLGDDIEGTSSGDLFGSTISLSGDGYRAAIGAIGNSAAKIYEYSNGNWNQLGSTITGDSSTDNFGSSLSLSMSGKQLAIGAPNHGNSNSNSGQVKIFSEINGVWTQQGLDIESSLANSLFGSSVSLSGTGEKLIVGSPGNSVIESDAGEVKSYKLLNLFAPVAEDSEISIIEDTQSTINLSVVDGDGDSLTIRTVSNPDNFTITYSGTTAIITPNQNFNGSSYFSFIANDGYSDSNAAKVSINISGLNDTPIAQTQSVTTNEDTDAIITLVATDTDEDEDALTYSIVSNPLHGTVSITGAVVTYSPASNYNGADSFTFKANDGSLDSNTSLVSISVSAVNDVPVVVNKSVTIDEDTTVTITLEATDKDEDALTYSIVSNPLHGTVSITGAVVTYSPASNYNGADSFTFKANDGSLDSNTSLVSISVSAVNDVPVVVNKSVTIDEDTTVTITLEATDKDEDALTYSIVSNPLHGTVSITGAVVTYSPASNYNGADSFTFKANDGSLDSNTSLVSISVSAVNDVPVVVNKSVTIDEDTTVTITLEATDKDEDALTYSIVSNPLHGTVSINGAVVTYTPEADYNGSDSFTYKANDGTVDSNVALVSISITDIVDLISPQLLFNNITKTYGDSSFELNVTSNSDATITYQSSNNSIASLTGNNVSINGAGIVTITALQESNEVYESETKSITLTVLKASPQYTTTAVEEKYSDSSIAIDSTILTSSSDGLLSYSSSDITVVELVDNTLKIKGTGSAKVSVSQESTANYKAGSTSFDVTITKSTPDLTFENIEKVYGDEPFNISVISTSSGALSFSSANTSIATINGSKLTIHNSGQVRIDAVQGPTADFDSSSTSMILTVKKKALTVSGITAEDKVYNGTISAIIDNSNVIFEGLVEGDLIEVATVGFFETKTALENKRVILSNTYSSSSLVNYNLIDQRFTTATIEKLNLTLTGAQNIEKTYDGTSLTPLGLNGLSELTGVLEDDSVFVVGAPQFKSKDVGAQTIIRGTVTLTGADAENYNLNWINGSGTINQKRLIIIAKNAAKFVSLNDDPNYKGVIYFGFENRETEAVLEGALNIERTNSDEEVGSYTGVLRPSGYSSANYSIEYSSGDFTIVPADQLIIEIEPTSTIEYSDTPTYNITGSYLSSVTSEVVVLGNPTFDPVTQMYTISNETESVTFAITAAAIITNNGKSRRPLSRSGNINTGSYGLDVVNTVINSDVISDEVVPLGSLTVIPKEIIATTKSEPIKDYDGRMMLPSIGVKLSGVVAGDDVSSSFSGYFNDQNAGTNKEYTIESLRLSGNDSGGYSLSKTSIVKNDGVINKILLEIKSNASSKIYDGKVNSIFSETYTGFVEGESKDNLNGSATYTGEGVTNTNVGTYNYSVKGYSSQNYTISYQPGTLTITKAPITVNGIVANDKVYDGTTNATINTSYMLIDNLVEGDIIKVKSSTAKFTTTDAGQSKTVELSTEFEGSSISNYLITQQASTTAQIIKAPLIVSVNTVSTPYLGVPYQNFTVSYNGFVNGEDENVLDGEIKFIGSGASSIETGVYDVSANGLVSHNYEIEFEAGVLTIIDSDTDNDGINDSEDPDIDGDGIINIQDADINGDGIIDNGIDTDLDGVNNAYDTDDDGDSWLDTVELECGSDPLDPNSIALDNDQDGIADCIDPDDDNDGIADSDDVNPFSSYESIDTDGDGIGNNADTDDDNDGQLDVYELGCGSDPLDVNSLSLDTDGDSIPDCFDTDDDNDSSLDIVDAFPLDATEDIDTDNDGIGNNTDSDDDNDGFSDEVELICGTNPLRIESQPGDYDGDGIADCVDNDIDGDGVLNDVDAFPMNSFESSDFDGDGYGDNIDNDDDNDGVVDTLDAYPYDSNQSGDIDADGVSDINDNDLDNDGFDDSILKVSGVLTPNNIGVESTWKVTNLELHPFNRVSVYDRSGVVVFQTENYKNDWRGTFSKNNELLPAGSYFYKVYLYDSKTTISGWVLLMY